MGVQTEYAENGELALYRMISAITGDSEPFDIVLMDINMPIMDGITAVTRFREWESNHWQTKTILDPKGPLPAGDIQQGLSHPRLFICALTGNTSTSDISQCFHAGCDAFLPKPFTPQELENMLRMYIESGVVVPYHRSCA